MPIIIDSEDSEEFEDASDFNNDDDIFTETPNISQLKHLSEFSSPSLASQFKLQPIWF